MANGRTKKTPFASWESTKADGIEKRYIRMGDTQMMSEAFNDLPHLAVRVYLYMKIESAGKRDFEFPYTKYKKFASKDGFRKALSDLESHGLIDIVEKNANIRCANIYRFSDRWKAFIKSASDGYI